jgi:glycosyltransferase involved in cell wall biosynthesis
LFVGVLSEMKGILVLIEACGKLAARGVPFQLELMGQWYSDDLAARVHQRIRDLNLSTHVRFLGMLVGAEKFAAYHRANVFCLPTFFETFGLVFVEAMACGLPVISTRCGGVPSVVDDGITGFLAEPNDSDAVAERLAHLAENPELCVRMGIAGRERFLREFTAARHVERMRKVFLDVGGLDSSAMREVPDALAATRSLTMRQLPTRRKNERSTQMVHEDVRHG